jgi:hypothetical protein
VGKLKQKLSKKTAIEKIELIISKLSEEKTDSGGTSSENRNWYLKKRLTVRKKEKESKVKIEQGKGN